MIDAYFSRCSAVDSFSVWNSGDTAPRQCHGVHSITSTHRCYCTPSPTIPPPHRQHRQRHNAANTAPPPCQRHAPPPSHPATQPRSRLAASSSGGHAALPSCPVVPPSRRSAVEHVCLLPQSRPTAHNALPQTNKVQDAPAEATADQGASMTPDDGSLQSRNERNTSNSVVRRRSFAALVSVSASVLYTAVCARVCARATPRSRLASTLTVDRRHTQSPISPPNSNPSDEWWQ